MAYTITRKQTVLGNERVVHLKVTADAATQTIDSGLGVIDSVQFSPGSLSTAAAKVYINVNASGVAANGSLGCSGFVSGDVFYATVFGR